jgi:hypothetical protein
MSKPITLTILTETGNIFSETDIRYVIPLYQRAFAWEDEEISQLIEDIKDFTEDNYYIGSLVVNKNGNQYEVIDGQQRLTALFLLLKSLKIAGVKDILTFACRKKSDETLKTINNLHILRDEDIEETLEKGKLIIDRIIGHNFDKKAFLNQLKKVKLFRIEVPNNTDLNRYFEIMNTRGEQLEQHDILKAKLMGYIKSNDNYKERFAKIWEACSDMTGYVQMHFDTNLRKDLFGDDWRDLPKNSLTKNMQSKSEKVNGFDIRNIVKTSFKVDNTDGINERDERIRFESIISFPYFLLHTLKVLIADKGIKHINDGESIINELLDDKKLTDTFDRVIKMGMIGNKTISENKESFSIDFINCLLRCRFLFDKYIVKREFINENSDGEWSIKQLKSFGQASNKKAYYSNTDFRQFGEWDKTRAARFEINLMLQSCLRVSYTSPKIMHWITDLLKWLYQDNCKNLNELNKFETKTESIAKKAVKADYLDSNDYNLSVNTPHIVFNYLDFLLWKEKRTADFVFEFRNSVEHWYPQHPSEDTFEKWADGVNNFGNLCIIQRNINSKFSNLSPDAKKSTFNEMIAKGSLKLRKMAELTVAGNGKNASYHWRDDVCKEHQKAMIDMLKKAVDVTYHNRSNYS